MGTGKWQECHIMAEKLELDVWYVENISFLLDLKIIYSDI